MDIHTVEVEYRETVSLPNYSNATHGTTLRADVQEGESEMAVESDLHAIAKARVQDRIDGTLESHGEAAKHYEGGRCQILASRRYQAVIVLPDDKDRPDGFKHPMGHREVKGLRPGHALEKGEEIAEMSGYEFFDLSEGEEKALSEYMDHLEEHGETFTPDDEIPF